MKKGLKKIALIGGLMLAGGIYSEGTFDINSKKEETHEKLSNLLEKQYEVHNTLRLEDLLKEEREKFSKPLYLSPDLLNAYIKQAYREVQKWPKEFDKRLFRLMLRQESRYNVHAKSKSGAMGLGQIMPITYKNFRPEEFAKLRDSMDIKRELFNPVKNIGLSLECLEDNSKFCERNYPSWDTLNLEDQRKTILACYNAGPGRIKELNWNLNSKELKEEQRKYPKVIMDAYHDSKIKVKL
ncbi:MAG: lytic transglycosylase domain-containing protein [Candidatus Diapherotrites archaeon]